MREIKYRAKSLEGSRMLYGKILQSNFSTFIVTMVNTINGDKISSVNYDEVDPDTVGQYTGVDDRDGNEIYEGDIIKFCFKDGGEVNTRYLEVLYRGSSFIMKEVYRDYWLEKKEGGGLLLKHGILESYKDDISTLYESNATHWTEVIGNVHEHPELLK